MTAGATATVGVGAAPAAASTLASIVPVNVTVALMKAVVWTPSVADTWKAGTVLLPSATNRMSPARISAAENVVIGVPTAATRWKVPPLTCLTENEIGPAGPSGSANVKTPAVSTTAPPAGTVSCAACNEIGSSTGVTVNVNVFATGPARPVSRRSKPKASVVVSEPSWT